MSEELKWVRQGQDEASAIERHNLRVRHKGSFWRDTDFSIRWAPRLKCWRVIRSTLKFTHPSGNKIYDRTSIMDFLCDPLDMAAVRQDAMDYAETTWRLQDANRT